jgi:PIN domain nuclease of toxin-antitoxin system
VAEHVLDSSVLLALLNLEPGWQAAERLMEGAVVSSVNLAEVVSKLVERGTPLDEIELIVDEMPCRFADVDTRQGVRMGFLHAETRGRNISLGDRACLTLGERLGLPIVTADRAWAALDLGVEIRLLR